LKHKSIIFFIGTEAEFIKLFPVIIECQKQGNICHIIASGQNDLNKSRILKFINLNGKLIELSKEENIRKSTTGLLIWFVNTKKNAVNKILKRFSREEISNIPMVVHGDTVSTLMGAMIGRELKMQVCHVEAGLRSHNLLNPFPEEIDRLLTSRFARVHFAPGDEPTNNLKKAKGKVINTKYNTILDSLSISRAMPIVTSEIEDVIKEDYFVFVMHRQENLANKEFVQKVVSNIVKVSKKKKCVLILHKITENTLSQMGLLEQFRQNDNFILLPRVDYFDFMRLLENSKFVITDGGSNQEELHYMGKPCLVMRKTTERKDGIGSNALMYGGDVNMILKFAKCYNKYERESIVGEYSPSKIISDNL
jgi:UDP-N-acetylglucosamine 2-epimerase (non-hydrolysing)